MSTLVSERDLDVVVLGASGVTGRGVAAYLASRAADAGLRWAVAGRSEGRLADVLARAGVQAPEMILADVGERGSLRAMAARTSVLLDLVGPYTLHGRPVIEACIAEGAHYADLTGEIPFVRRVIEDLHAAATAAGVKIAQVCGFEALPPDLSVQLASETARERWGEALAGADVELSIASPPGLPRPSDGISGGTIHSLLAVAAEPDSALIRDPAALITDAPAAAEVRRASPIPLAPRRGHRGAVIAPMAPAPFINPAVIHRSALLAAEAEGRPPAPFRYREGLAMDGGAATLPLRACAAGALSTTQVGLRALSGARPGVRRRVTGVLARLAPPSGYGPAADRMDAWSWEMTTYARTTGGHELEVHIDADGHPGYLTTARMLGELGILLAEDGATPPSAGCLTPAAALGTACLDRFERAGVRFSLDS